MSRLLNPLFVGTCTRCGCRALVRKRRTGNAQQRREYACVACVPVDSEDMAGPYSGEFFAPLPQIA